MSRLGQDHCGEMVFTAAAVAEVVGGVGVPAGPGDAQPGAGEDADGVWVAAAAGACVAVASLEQPAHQQSIWPLDRYRQLARERDFLSRSSASQTPRSLCANPNRLTTAPPLVDDAELMRSARPVDPDEHLLTSLIDDTCLGAEGPSRFLTRWPSMRLTPNVGRGPSARSGRRDSCWLSGSKARWPSPSGRQEHHCTLTSGSDGMVQERG